MDLYEPKSCCNNFNTKKGSLIIASLTLIGSILNIAVALTIYPFCVLHPWDLVTKVVTPGDENSSKIAITMIAMIATITWYSLFVILSSLLIYGIRKHRPGLMLPFIACSWAGIAIKVICCLVVTALAIYYQNIVIVSGTSILLIFISIETYFVLVITAYHKYVNDNLSDDIIFNREELDRLIVE